MSDHLTWRELAVGVGLIGIVAYFLWPAADAPTAQVRAEAQAAPVFAGVNIPGLPAYLTSNRPSYAVEPSGDVQRAAWAHGTPVGLPMGDGLVLNPDGVSYRGGMYVGGNYVGSRVFINSPGAVTQYDTPDGARPVIPSPCHC